MNTRKGHMIEDLYIAHENEAWEILERMESIPTIIIPQQKNRENKS